MKKENKLLIQCVNTNSELVNSSSFDGLFERNTPRVWIDVEVGHSSCITRYTVFELVVWGLKEHNIFFIRHTGSKKFTTFYSTYFTLPRESNERQTCGSESVADTVTISLPTG